MKKIIIKLVISFWNNKDHKDLKFLQVTFPKEKPNGMVITYTFNGVHSFTRYVMTQIYLFSE